MSAQASLSAFQRDNRPPPKQPVKTPKDGGGFNPPLGKCRPRIKLNPKITIDLTGYPQLDIRRHLRNRTRYIVHHHVLTKDIDEWWKIGFIQLGGSWYIIKHCLPRYKMRLYEGYGLQKNFLEAMVYAGAGDMDIVLYEHETNLSTSPVSARYRTTVAEWLTHGIVDQRDGLREYGPQSFLPLRDMIQETGRDTHG